MSYKIDSSIPIPPSRKASELTETVRKMKHGDSIVITGLPLEKARMRVWRAANGNRGPSRFRIVIRRIDARQVRVWLAEKNHTKSGRKTS